MSSNLDVRAATAGRGATSGRIPVLYVEGPWEKLLLGRGKLVLELLLPGILRTRRWFGGKGRKIDWARIVQSAGIEYEGARYYLCMIRVQYREGADETYVLPLSFVPGARARELLERDPAGVLLSLSTGADTGVVYDAARDRQFACALLAWIGGQQSVSTDAGEIDGIRTGSFDGVNASGTLEPYVMSAEQSNTSIRFGEQFILKLFRRIERGTNPDFEIGRFLTERRFASCAPVSGALELRDGGSEPSTLAVLQGFVRNRGDAWNYTLDSLRVSCDKAIAQRDILLTFEAPLEPLLQLADEAVPHFIENVAADYLRSAALLGRRTAEMHLTLASGEDPDFAPEPFTADYRWALYRSTRDLCERVLELLRSHLVLLSESDRRHAESLLNRRDELLDQFRAIIDVDLEAMRIRVHGDYHLGQVLFTGDDFVIIDFEGEPLRPIRERRLKRSALQDVAGMLRSFQYAGFSVLMERRDTALDAAMERFTGAWASGVSAVFMREYLRTCGAASFLPGDRNLLATVLNVLQLEKAVYELGYEINNRPAWVRVPVAGITRLLDERAEEARGLRRVA